MLYNSGTPSLVSHTRFLVGDPSTAPSSLYSDAEIQAAINLEYIELGELARSLGAGWGAKRTYATSVADQILYQKPDDWVRFISIEIEPDGKDLSSDSSAAGIYLKPRNESRAMEAYNVTGVSSPEFYFMQDNHFGVVSPVSTGGANALRLTYEAETSSLSNDTDEPFFYSAHHPLICYRAAINLKVSKDLPINNLFPLAEKKELAFIRSMQDTMEHDDIQIPVAGNILQHTAIKQGRIIRK
jgi:hypothetical protein